jgi:hypothetical protein
MRPMKTIVASTTVLLMAASAFAQLKKNDIEKLHEAAAHRMSRNPESTGDG